MTLATLATRWGTTADELERFGATAQAAAVRACVEELRAALDARGDELLTLAEAAAASGYSKRRLRELAAEGSLPNHGRTGAPRFRRSELPRKAQPSSDTGFDADAEVARLLDAG